MSHTDHQFPSRSLEGQPRTRRMHCAIAAGDGSDLGDIRAWCATLPTHSYGQVFIEVHSADQIELIDTPRHVGVTWICRDQLRSAGPSVIAPPRGQALAGSVDGWLDEWIRADDGCWQYSLWMGARSSSIMRSYWMRVESELDELWSHQLLG